jgi:putative toxin-antitoxin system antitoxin component (TIGR02293 family)
MFAGAEASVPELLGLRKHSARSCSALGLMSDIEKGLPMSALRRIVRTVAPTDPSFAYRLLPCATLARRRTKPSARLTPREGDRVARLALVWAVATEVWKSDAAARRWLFEPHMLLADRRPVEVVLANEFGRPPVGEILGRIKFGTGL